MNETPDRAPADAWRADGDFDVALRAAFERHPEASVLEALESFSLDIPRVLLREHEEAARSSPLLVATSDEHPDGQGHLHVLGEIARGGMGVVLKGHDRDLGRDVAMKVLREDQLGNPDVVRRFVEEAQIGGQLQHPGIVPVYELGMMSDRRPYFAMKLVHGRTLSTLLAERGSPADGLHHLVSIFGQVCQAVGYAHSRGVIHRDLKPSNVMIGSFGEVQVVDWGLAKVLRRGGAHDEAARRRGERVSTVRMNAGSAGSQSVVGSVMGTPAYMPPEQARGEVDTLDERSDVFALGATLCEILTSSPPYPGRGRDALTAAAAARTGPALERLETCGAPAEMVALARTCLSTEPCRRPRDASAVAESVSAYQASVEERAQAARIAAAEARVKAGQERKARRLTVALAASVVLFVGVAGGGSAWLAQRNATRGADATRQLDAALGVMEVLRERAESASDERSWQQVRTAAEGALALAAHDALPDARRADTQARVEAVRAAADEAERARNLDARNRALLTRLEEVRVPEGDENYPVDWSAVGAQYAAILRSEGLDVDVVKAAEGARWIRARGIAVELASALDAWGAARELDGDPTGARRLTEFALQADEDPRRTRLRRAIATEDLGELRAFLTEEALEDLPLETAILLADALARLDAPEDALRVDRSVQRLHPEDFVANVNLARSLLHPESRDAAGAVRYFQAALSLRPDSIEVRHELGRALIDGTGDREEARSVFQEAVRRRPDDAHLLDHLGTAAYELGRVDEAVGHYREALRLAPDSARIHANFATIARRTGALDTALEHAREALRLDPGVVEALGVIGSVHYDRNELQAALQACTEACRRFPNHAALRNSLAVVLRDMGALDAAIEEFREAARLDPEDARHWEFLAYALRQAGHSSEAAEAFRETIARNPGSTDTRRMLGHVLAELGDDAGAERAFLEAVFSDSEDPDAHCELGLHLMRTGRPAEALEALRRGHELGSRDTSWTHPSEEWIREAERRLAASSPDGESP